MTRFVNLIAGKWAIPILYRLIVLNTPLAAWMNEYGDQLER
jgi:DNA-binding HxlR family transcriptional regulator